MDIELLKAEKTVLESKILELLKEFEYKTGYSPDAIEYENNPLHLSEGRKKSILSVKIIIEI